MEITVITVLLGITSTVLCYWITRQWFTPCFLYYFAWIIGLICVNLTVHEGLFNPLDSFGKNLILQAHTGAFLGFVISSSLYALTIKSNKRPSVTAVMKQPHMKLLWYITGILFVSGCISLGNKIAVHGISMNFLLAVRADWFADLYMAEQIPFSVRITRYCLFLSPLLLIILAVRDVANNKMNIKQLVLVFVAGVPLGLSEGSRGWLLSPITYIFTMIYLCEIYNRKDLLKRLFSFIIVYLLIFMTLVSVIDFVRSGAFGMGGERNRQPILSMLQPVYVYGAIPIVATSVYSEFALLGDRTWGGLSFPFFSVNMDRLGIINADDIKSFLRDSRDYVAASSSHALSMTHATFIPALVKDFGPEWLWIGSCALFAIMQWSVLYGRGKGGFVAGFLFMWGGLNGAFASAQTYGFGELSGLLPLFAGLALSFYGSWKKYAMFFGQSRVNYKPLSLL